jgi:hypothetical protein
LNFSSSKRFHIAQYGDCCAEAAEGDPQANAEVWTRTGEEREPRAGTPRRSLPRIGALPR